MVVILPVAIVVEVLGAADAETIGVTAVVIVGGSILTIGAI